MRSPPGKGTMPTLNDVTGHSRWSSDTRTPTTPNPGEHLPGTKPPGRQECENLAKEPAGLRQASPAAPAPPPGASPELTPPRGRCGRAATRFHWGPREESCQTPSPSKRRTATQRASARGYAAMELRCWAHPPGPQRSPSTREHSGETAGPL